MVQYLGLPDVLAGGITPVDTFADLPINMSEGTIRYVKDEDTIYVFNGSSWDPISASAVSGPGSSTDNALARWDGTSGSTIQNSAVLLDDSGNLSGIASLDAGQISSSVFSGGFALESSGQDIIESGVTNTELGYLSGVASSIQDQLDGQIAKIGASTDSALVRWDGTNGSGLKDSLVTLDDVGNLAGLGTVTATTYTSDQFSGDLVLITQGTLIAESGVSTTELEYLIGTESSVQDQLDGKIPLSYMGTADGVATLDSGGKVPAAQLPNTVMEYQGAWNASTNSPTLADGTGNTGDVYRASVAGTQNLGSGSQTWGVGDLAIYNGSIWQHSPAADGVSSVNGFTGAVVLTYGDITSGIVPTANGGTGQNSTATFPSSGTVLTDTNTVSPVLNKTLDSATLFISPSTDTTKKVRFSIAASHTTGTTLTLKTFNTANQTLNIPDTGGTDTFVLVTQPATLTNKTIDGAFNTLSVDASTQLYNQVPAANGGTGISSTATFPSSGVIVTEAASEVLTNKTINGSSNTLTVLAGSQLSGQVPMANGGTNKNMTAVNGGVVWTDADSMEVTAAGTSGQFLKSGGAATPTWSAVDLATSSVTGVLPLANGGTAKNMTAVAGGIVWTDADSMEVTSAGTSGDWVLSGGSGAPTMSSTATTLKTFSSGAAVIANVRASEGAGTTTLTISDNRRQIFQLSAGRTCVLPTTNVIAGDTWTIENTAAFDLTIQASGGSALTVANGANMDATIQKGIVVLIALQNTPTTPAHWSVSYVSESYSLDVSSSGNFNAGQTPIRFTRMNRSVTASWASIAHAAVAGPATAAGLLPTRFRPFATADNAFSTTTSHVLGFSVSTGGTVSFFYNDWTGAVVSARTSSNPGSSSWTI